jgi:hypothetical protein
VIPTGCRFPSCRFRSALLCKVHKIPVAESIRFLDPEQLKKAQHLVKVHMATEKPSDNALMDGVTRYLRALREFAAQHMLKKWARGEWISITIAANTGGGLPFDSCRIRRVQTKRVYSQCARHLV